MRYTEKRFIRWWNSYGKKVSWLFKPEYSHKLAYEAGYRAARADYEP